MCTVEEGSECVLWRREGESVLWRRGGGCSVGVGVSVSCGGVRGGRECVLWG